MVLGLALPLTAQTSGETVRDATGRLVQTVERQRTADGTVRSIARDAGIW
jgi:hypothetical protein